MSVTDASGGQIAGELRESARLMNSLASDPSIVDTIRRMADAMIACLRGGGTIYLLGNGGSAADAQHIAGELVGRFRRERGGYACVALSTDTSVMTAVANDYGYEAVFARQVDGLVRRGDVVLGITTSGNSGNILLALELARERGAAVLGLSGCGGGKLAELADVCLTVPSNDTPRVQECHGAIGHILCGLIEQALCDAEPSDD